MRSAWLFSLTDSSTRRTTDSSADGTTHNSTGHGTRSGFLFNGRAAGGSTDGYGGKSNGQGKAFHQLSSSDMVKPERHETARVPTRSDGSARSEYPEVSPLPVTIYMKAAQHAWVAFNAFYVVAASSNTVVSTTTDRSFKHFLRPRRRIPEMDTAMLRRTQILRIKHIEAINGWLKARPRRKRAFTDRRYGCSCCGAHPCWVIADRTAARLPGGGIAPCRMD